MHDDSIIAEMIASLGKVIAENTEMLKGSIDAEEETQRQLAHVYDALRSNSQELLELRQIIERKNML
jgi:hypothetical protein